MAAKGVRELEDYRKNVRVLSRKEAMLAFCADCMNLYQDGLADCENTRCPMFPYRPYPNKERTKQ